MLALSTRVIVGMSGKGCAGRTPERGGAGHGERSGGFESLDLPQRDGTHVVAVAQRQVPRDDARERLVIQLATDALDEIRREVWNEARRAGQARAAKDLMGARYALWKNPENLTDRQVAKLADIQKTNRPLYRAYLLKEQLRQIYRLPADAAITLLDDWIAWARRCRLAPFVKLAKTITKQRAGIVAAIEHGLSKRPRRSDQHADPDDYPTRVRLSQPRRADRARDALARRPVPAASAVK
jgi:hypothetical protein